MTTTPFTNERVTLTPDARAAFPDLAEATGVVVREQRYFRPGSHVVRCVVVKFTVAGKSKWAYCLSDELVSVEGDEPETPPPAEPANSSASQVMEAQLGGRGARVRTRSGTEGTLLHCEGRVAHVQTDKGVKQWDALYCRRVEAQAAPEDDEPEPPKMTDEQIAAMNHDLAVTSTRLTQGEPIYKVGDKVLVEGSDVVGEITEVGTPERHPGQVRVRRPNPNSPGVNMTHWIKVNRVMLAPNYIPDTPKTTPEMVESTVTVNTTVEKPITFRTGMRVRVTKTGKEAIVTRASLWGVDRIEKCHLEFPPAVGEKRPTYYWYPVVELERIGAKGEAGL